VSVDIEKKLKEKEDDSKKIVEQINEVSRQINVLQEKRQLLLSQAVENNGAIKMLKELKDV
jgi:hypothetical protein